MSVSSRAPSLYFVARRKRTAALLKISEATVSKYVNLTKKGKDMLTPNKTRRRQHTMRVLDSFDRLAVQSLIYELHRKRKYNSLE